MKIIINQFFGIGDIIFCQNIAKRFIEMGHTVTWPVLPNFLEGLQRAYPAVTFVDMYTLNMDYERKDEHDWNGYRVVPLRFSDSLLNLPYDQCMASKYKLFGWDYNDWKDGAEWKRDQDEMNIIDDLSHDLGFNLRDGGYVLLNENYQSDLKGRKQIDASKFSSIVYMNRYDGYSMFDWAKVIQNAAEIHTVSTSLFYMLELLPLTQPIHLYPRPNDPTFSHIKYLFTKDYRLVYK